MTWEDQREVAPAEEGDWGAEGGASCIDQPGPEGQGLWDLDLDLGLEPGAVGWPGPGAGPAGSRLAEARRALVGEPGVAHRLERAFATGAGAAQAAEAFVEDADPGHYVPGARGHFEAVPERGGEGRWHVVVRFVAEGPPTAFLGGGEWVLGWLLPTVRRPLKAGSYWCPQWWEHPEAVQRLGALWEAWESARAEGGSALSYWWTVHFDPHWSVLTSSAAGPFAACARRGQHSDELGCLPGSPRGPEDMEKMWRAMAR